MKRIVIKIGTHVIYEDGILIKQRLENLVSFIKDAMQKYQIILVSSGAIATGYSRIQLDKKIVKNRQALAAIGQPYLMHIYDKCFEKYNIKTAQLLLTAEDFDSRKRTKRSNDAVEALLENNILPIINENDTTAIDEIVFGDNDQLSAHAAHFFDANLLVLLSDIDGYYDDDPREKKEAKIRKLVHKIDEKELTCKTTAGTLFATGGIVTKLKAANFLLEQNRAMFLTSGFDLKDLRSFLLEKNHKGGTLFSLNDWKL